MEHHLDPAVHEALAKWAADDLRSALVSAYNSNPTLEAARANQRANDENITIVDDDTGVAP